jgi:hypothetical protein
MSRSFYNGCSISELCLLILIALLCFETNQRQPEDMISRCLAPGIQVFCSMDSAGEGDVIVNENKGDTQSATVLQPSSGFIFLKIYLLQTTLTLTNEQPKFYFDQMW